jgi:hypothetical protein
LAFEKTLLISVYNRDKPIRTLSEFDYYLSLLTSPEYFIDVPEGRRAIVKDDCESPRALFNELSAKICFLGVKKRH